MSEDDWETADLTTSVTAAAKAKSKLSLRAGAPTFQPRPSTTTPSADAGPSRSTPTTGSYAARSPIPGSEGSRGGSPLSGGGGGDEWFRGPRPASNRQIWDAANKHLASPLPTIIGSNPTIASPIPQPGITILRREPGANDKKRGGGTATPPKTMEEREEEYRLTRERIFGGNAAVTADLGDGALGREQSRSGGGRSRIPQSQSTERRELFEPSLGIVPVQVRRSPAPPSNVLRQPMGPGEGGGFGR